MSNHDSEKVSYLFKVMQQIRSGARIKTQVCQSRKPMPLTTVFYPFGKHYLSRLAFCTEDLLSKIRS